MKLSPIQKLHEGDAGIRQHIRDPDRRLVQLSCDICGEHAVFRDSELMKKHIRPDQPIACPRCQQRGEVSLKTITGDD